jgi:hypothetical protein
MKAAPGLAHCTQSKFCIHDKSLPPRQSLPRHCAVLPRQIQNNMTISQLSCNCVPRHSYSSESSSRDGKKHAIPASQRDSFVAKHDHDLPRACVGFRLLTLLPSLRLNKWHPVRHKINITSFVIMKLFYIFAQ